MPYYNKLCTSKHLLVQNDCLKNKLNYYWCWLTDLVVPGSSCRGTKIVDTYCRSKTLCCKVMDLKI